MFIIIFKCSRLKENKLKKQNNYLTLLSDCATFNFSFMAYFSSFLFSANICPAFSLFALSNICTNENKVETTVKQIGKR